jgi:hypothetical protein
MNVKRYLVLLGITAILLVSFWLFGFSEAQVGGDLPTPMVETEVLSSESEGEEAVRSFVVIAKVSEEDACECGAIFEMKRNSASEWEVLGIVSPRSEGDTRPKFVWQYAGNFPEIGSDYSVRAKLFGRQGEESAYAEHSFTMVPAPNTPCINDVFANLQKSTFAIKDVPHLQFTWDRVCVGEREATTYKIFKNGELVREQSQSTAYFITAGSPSGDIWKIEAYGEEPPDQNNAIIRSCSEVISKLNARLNDRPTIIAAVRVARLLQCQQVDGLLRTIVEWEPYTHCAVNCNYVSPDYWVTWSAFTPPPNQGHWQPLFNYPTPSSPVTFWWPGPPGPGSWELLKMGWRCRKASTNADNGNNGFNSDPMNQVGWTCPGTWTNGELGPNTVYRQWLNFDLVNIPPPSSVWPITTEFVY